MPKIVFSTLCFVSMLISGCAFSTQVTNTPRSSIEQGLLITSLERGLARLDTKHLKGATVAVEFYGLTSDKDFAREFLTAWLQSNQVQIVTNPRAAQLRLKVFVPVFAVDQAQSSIGSPSFTVPFLGITIPKISLFKIVRQVAILPLKAIQSTKTVEISSLKVAPRSVIASMMNIQT